MLTGTIGSVVGVMAVILVSIQAQGQTPAPATSGATTTRDIKFTSHDGHAMHGRLTLPDTPGRHPVLVLVQTAEAAAMEPQTRNAQGERVPVYSLYRNNLAPLGIGFFTYEGRGVFTSATGGREIDRAVFDTSTLDNKVRDGIAAVRVLQKEAGVDTSQIFLRGISEGTLLAAQIASSIPNEVKGLVLSGVIGDTLKSSLKFMASSGAYMQHLGHWDADGDGKISAQEFEADPKKIRRQMPPTVMFRSFDTDGDGSYTMAEYLARSKPLVDMIEAENLDVIERWLQASAAMPVPSPTRAWLKDHFSQPSMWALVSKLPMPVGFFQGEIDANTPAADVRALEQKAKAAGKTNLEFSYYAGLDHGLGTMEYFTRGTPSAGYAAMFAFMRRHTQGGSSLGNVPGNLLINPRADLGGSAWSSSGDATIEQRDGNPSFVVRNSGRFQQTVNIPSVPGRKYAVFLARAASERINPDGSITGLPYLYGMMLSGERGRILAHLQGQGMRTEARKPDEWSTLWGVFEVPEGTVAILFQLGQGERRGDPQNGSAARFDDVALLLSPTLDEAKALVQKYR